MSRVEKVKVRCPFCGSEVEMSHGTLNLPIVLFTCTNFKNCGAVVSFDNPMTECFPNMAINFWAKRNNDQIERNDDQIEKGETNC